MDTRSKSKQPIVCNQAESPILPEKSPKDKLINPIEGTSSQDETGNNPRPQSPEPNCSICLGKLENKSFTDNCFHTFCFVCLLEWSKVKAVCPLCKQPFKSIIHNVRSFEDYDQYHVKSEEQQMIEALEQRRFRFRTTMTNEQWWDHLRQEQQRQLDLLRRPSRSTIAAQWRRQRQAATSAYRRRIYANGVRVQEVRTATGRTMRYREVAPEFYMRNPACTHRLVPWLNRELNVLLSNQEDHVQFVLELIMDLIKRFGITSEEFFQHIQPFTGVRTEHFVHEFYSFARSPYDMFAYDQRAVYGEPEEQLVHTIDSSDDESSISSSINDIHMDLIDDDDDDDDDVILLSGPTTLLADELTTSQDHPYSSVQDGASEPVDNPTGTSLPGPFDLEMAPFLDRVHSFLASINPEDSVQDSVSSSNQESSNNQDSSNGQQSSGTQNNGTESTQGTSGESSGKKPTNTKKGNKSNVPLFIKVKKESGDESESESSDVLVVGYDKPWEERTPEPLSSEDEEEKKAVLARAKERLEEERKKLQKLKRKSRSRSRSMSRTHSRRHRSPSRSRKNSRDRIRSRSRDSSYRNPDRYRYDRQRSRSRERIRQESRESRYSRTKDPGRSKDIRSRRSRSGSRSSRHDKRRRTRSPSITTFSALGKYDFDEVRARKQDKKEKERSERHRVTKSPKRMSDSRRDDHQSRNGARGRRSRSKSIEVVFRRRDRSKERRKKEINDRLSPVDSISSKSKHRHKRNVSPSTSTKSHSKHKSHEKSSKSKDFNKRDSTQKSNDYNGKEISVHRRNASDDELNEYKTYKKNSTGHKSSKCSSSCLQQEMTSSEKQRSSQQQKESSKNMEDRRNDEHRNHARKERYDGESKHKHTQDYRRDRNSTESKTSVKNHSSSKSQHRERSYHSQSDKQQENQRQHAERKKVAEVSSMASGDLCSCGDAEITIHAKNDNAKTTSHSSGSGNPRENNDRRHENVANDDISDDEKASDTVSVDEKRNDDRSDDENSTSSSSDESETASVPPAEVISESSSDSEVEVLGASHPVEDISSESDGESDIEVTSHQNETSLTRHDLLNRQRNYLEMLQEDIRKADGVLNQMSNRLTSSHNNGGNVNTVQAHSSRSLEHDDEDRR